jgi:hypothetical protein
MMHTKIILGKYMQWVDVNQNLKRVSIFSSMFQVLSYNDLKMVYKYGGKIKILLYEWQNFIKKYS